ncbi:hypothetical protein CR159_06620 [Pollutimonas subterranea]|uniref:Uncharacterized protein n=1 Tax=Pollutimonas subterranea TaxID=2045210 RepID=A0A2N4U6M0_9BURK|nr:hypothetical protein [Pollutimonas subterranea]PLC50672.1 hypothetical protein CR159_06620 [Pollutimonas subterranea]
MTAARSPSLWRAMTGLAIWMLCFVALYGGHALGCRYRVLLDEAFGLPMLTWLLVLIWAISLAVLLWLAARSLSSLRLTRVAGSAQPLSRFMSVLTLTVDISGFVSTVAIGLPLLWMPVCA